MTEKTLGAQIFAEFISFIGHRKPTPNTNELGFVVNEHISKPPSEFRRERPTSSRFFSTMPPRAITERSPSGVMRWSDDVSCSSGSVESRGLKKYPLVKALRFEENMNRIHPIPHLDEMPQSEVRATWYTAEEYGEIKAAYQLTIFMMEAGEELKVDEHTSRGLEYRTQEGAWARYENKRDAYNAVLDEQDRQWQRDVDDHDEIARIYLQHSAKCAEAAASRAAVDEIEAREILKSIIPPKRRSIKKKNSDLSKKLEKDKLKIRRSKSADGERLLPERSSSRRTEVRDDIKLLQKKALPKPLTTQHKVVAV
jgi:hypothetical protein